MKSIASVAMLLLFCLNTFSQQVAKTIPNATSPDGRIGFLEFRPSDYGSQKHPLIIFLHGIGERGNGSTQINTVANNAIPLYCSRGATMRFTVAGQTSSFVVLSPQLSTSYGYWPSFYVKEMIKYAKANLQIDPDRIYITGLSLGGGGIWGNITDASEPSFDAGIAAAAPVCGTQQEDDNMFCSTIGTNHLPVWAFHAMDDAVVGVGSTQHAEILARNCGVTPAMKFTYYQTGGHSGAWINAYDTGHITKTAMVNGVASAYTANPNLYEWFLSNKRSTGTATPAYTAPIANAGTAQTITLPLATVSLSGSGTGTNGATITGYSWAKTSGPAGGVIVSAGSTVTAIIGLLVGTYSFTLTVTDNHGLTSSATVSVTVNAAAAVLPTAPVNNQAPVSVAGADATVTLPTNSVALNGSASYDADGTVVEYYWSQSSGPSTASIVNNFSVTATASNLVQGVYKFVLQAKDNAGAMGYSVKTITVNAAPVATGVNQKPVSNAGADAAITLPTNSIALNGTASYDPDGTITEFYWSQASGPSTASIGNNFSVSTTAGNLVKGVYVFVLQAKDNAGAMAYSTKTITVNAAIAAAGNQSPVSNAGPDAIVTLPTASVSLNGSASYDTDGTIVEYYWSQVSGPSSTVIANPFAVSTTAANLVKGVYVLVLQTKDDKGGMGYSLKKVTVNSAGTTTTAAAVTAAQPIGYIKISTGPYQACDDASSTGRTAIYSPGISNGGIVYTDAAMTSIYNGGWNWFSFTPVLGGATTYAFAIFPNGAIAMLRNCLTGTNLRTANSSTTAEADIAALSRMKDSAAASLVQAGMAKLSLYPNPVHTSATIELTSTDNGVKIIGLYDANGALKAKYNWQTTTGRNLYSLKDMTGLANGFYVLEITDARGKRIGVQKFLKM